MPQNWMDISVPLYTGMVHWPDNPPVVIERMLDMDRGDICNVSKLSLGAHTGTHMDAPIHFLAHGTGIDQIPLDAAVGRARVIEIEHTQAITREELQAHQIASGERILFKTHNSVRAWQSGIFIEDFVYIAQDAARYLAEAEVRTVGVDYLSVGGFTHDGPETHQILLEAGIWLIEGLNLCEVAPGTYELICLPLRILNGDGAPARAMLRAYDPGL